MYKTTSEQSGRRSLLTATLDVVNRGFVCDESDRDCVFDLTAWIDRTIIDNKPTMIQTTIQVKTMQGNRICKEVNRSNEVVCKGGKTRNSISYANEGVDWIVGVDKEGVCNWYKWETYSKIPTKSFSVNKYPPDKFPSRTVPSNNSNQIKFKNTASWTTQS